MKTPFIYFYEKILLRKPASVLMYHSISNDRAFFAVSPEAFEWQMKYLKANNYNVISLEEFFLAMREKNIASNTVVITFDDGYKDNYLAAFPVFKKYNFPATIFLTTGKIGSENYMEWSEIQDMHKSGLIDFEPHTVTHPKLSKSSSSEAEREMKESKEKIEDKLSKKCDFFAYPYGDYDEKSLEICRNLFKAALTVKRGFMGKPDNIHELKRNSIDSLTTSFLFKLKI